MFRWQNIMRFVNKETLLEEHAKQSSLSWPDASMACMFLSEGRGVKVKARVQAPSRRWGEYLSASFNSPRQLL